MSKTGWRGSRRALLKSSLFAALGAAIASRGWQAVQAATATSLPLITKAIPSTGELIPAIGIGTNSFSLAQFAQLKELLGRMHQAGGTMIDTSSDYGDSEVVIGRALAELGIRKDMFISTKGVSKDGWPRWISSVDKIEHDSLEVTFPRSLQRLQTDHVDLLLAHHLRSVKELMPQLLDLKKAGKARYIGIATERWFEHQQLMDYMKQYPVDWIQVDYSIGNREAAEDVLTLAAERRIAVVLDIPLKFRADWGSHGDSLLTKVGKLPLPPWAAEIDVTSWSQYILKYAISHPAVTVACPGTTSVEHMLENQQAGRGRLPDAAMRKRMEDYWDSVS